jgi:hypothetical protein
MTPLAKIVAHVGIKPRLHMKPAGECLVRCKRAREVRRIEHRGVNRLLKVAPKDSMCEKKLERPLVLLVTARGSESESRLPVQESE